MGLQNGASKDMRLVLSKDAKPRLKWTPQLHQRFVDAVTQLGGADKAAPKSLKSIMNIHGLTLYHLKSHLQKYRLAKSQLAHENRQENNLESAIKHNGRKEDENSRGLEQRNYFDAKLREKQSVDIRDAAQIQMNDLQLARTLKVQMEVQRKLHEQIEVQRHLQLRIEAQGKYVQIVLMKAQETLARYGSSDELAKAELCQFVSMVNNYCPSSSLSAVDGSISKDRDRNSPSSSLSTLTKIDDSITKDVGPWKRINSSILPLMEMNPGNRSGSNAEANISKRRRTNICNGNWIEEPSGKIRDTQRTNEQFTSGPQVIDFIGRCF